MSSRGKQKINKNMEMLYNSFRKLTPKQAAEKVSQMDVNEYIKLRKWMKENGKD